MHMCVDMHMYSLSLSLSLSFSLSLSVHRSRLESLSKTLKRVKAESSREIEVLEQGN